MKPKRIEITINNGMKLKKSRNEKKLADGPVPSKDPCKTAGHV